MAAAGVLRAADLARMTKHTPQQVERWLNGKTKNPRAADMFSVGDALKVSARWLLFNQGSMGQYTTVTPDERELLTIYHALPDGWRDDWVNDARKTLDRLGIKTPQPEPPPPGGREKGKQSSPHK